MGGTHTFTYTKLHVSTGPAHVLVCNQREGQHVLFQSTHLWQAFIRHRPRHGIVCQLVACQLHSRQVEKHCMLRGGASRLAAVVLRGEHVLPKLQDAREPVANHSALHDGRNEARPTLPLWSQATTICGLSHVGRYRHSSSITMVIAGKRGLDVVPPVNEVQLGSRRQPQTRLVDGRYAAVVWKLHAECKLLPHVHKVQPQPG